MKTSMLLSLVLCVSSVCSSASEVRFGLRSDSAYSGGFLELAVLVENKSDEVILVTIPYFLMSILILDAGIEVPGGEYTSPEEMPVGPFRYVGRAELPPGGSAEFTALINMWHPMIMSPGAYVAEARLELPFKRLDGSVQRTACVQEEIPFTVLPPDKEAMDALFQRALNAAIDSVPEEQGDCRRLQLVDRVIYSRSRLAFPYVFQLAKLDMLSQSQLYDFLFLLRKGPCDEAVQSLVTLFRSPPESWNNTGNGKRNLALWTIHALEKNGVSSIKEITEEITKSHDCPSPPVKPTLMGMSAELCAGSGTGTGNK